MTILEKDLSSPAVEENYMENSESTEGVRSNYDNENSSQLQPIFLNSSQLTFSLLLQFCMFMTTSTAMFQQFFKENLSIEVASSFGLLTVTCLIAFGIALYAHKTSKSKKNKAPPSSIPISRNNNTFNIQKITLAQTNDQQAPLYSSRIEKPHPQTKVIDCSKERIPFLPSSMNSSHCP